MHEELAAFKALYPGLSQEELELAKENLDRYLSLAWEIYEDSLLSHHESVAPSLAPDLAVASRGKVDSKQT